MRIPGQKELDRKLKYWQARLSLRDWSITVKFSRMCHLGESTLGDVFPGNSKREATIRLIHPDDVEGQNFWDTDAARCWERTLVHELLHLHMKDVLPKWHGSVKRAKYRAAERMIDAVAKALVPDVK